jgi:hypothetical protein
LRGRSEVFVVEHVFLEIRIRARVVFPAVQNDGPVFATDVFPVRGLAPEDLLELRNRERLDLVCGWDIDGKGVQRDAELLRLGGTAFHQLLPFLVLDRAARICEVSGPIDQRSEPSPRTATGHLEYLARVGVHEGLRPVLGENHHCVGALDGQRRAGPRLWRGLRAFSALSALARGA